MSVFVQVAVQEKFYLRDPFGTELGTRIVSEGILLMEQLGYDQFTFRKLAMHIDSTEASVYRYFESKSQFLQFLVCWYWNWVGFLIDYRTQNLKDPVACLKQSIALLAETDRDDPTSTHIDEAALHHIVIAESARVYMTRQMDAETRSEIFLGYGVLVKRLSGIIKKVKPRYRHAEQLAMTTILTIHQQMLLEDGGDFIGVVRPGERSRSGIVRFAQELVFSALQLKS